MRYIRLVLLGLLAVMLMAGATTVWADSAEGDGGETPTDEVVLKLVNSKMPTTSIGHIYDEQMEVTGGTAPYTFRLTNGNLPKGMVLTESGRLTSVEGVSGYTAYGKTGVGGGVLTSGGYVPFSVRVTDSVGNTQVLGATIQVIYEKMDIQVTNNRYTWEPDKTYAATLIATPDFAQGEYYTVEYIDLSTGKAVSPVVNAGSYRIEVKATPKLYEKGYLMGSMNSSQLIINRNATNTLAVSGCTVDFGEEYEITPSVTPEALLADTTLWYKGTGDTSYSSATKPTNAGRYIVTATTNNRNYAAKSTTASVTINPLPVAFTVDESSLTQTFENGHGEYKPTVTAEVVKDGAEYSQYKLVYTNKDTEAVSEQVLYPGEYTWEIVSTNANYTVQGDVSGTFTLHGTGMVFAAADCEYTYDGLPHKATVTCEGLPESEEFTVSYKDKNGDTVAEPTNAGEYEILVTLSETSEFTVGGVVPNKLVIKQKEVSFTADKGSAVYDRTDKTPSITPDIEGFDKFTVSWKKGEEAQDALVNSGKYVPTVTLTDDNYILGDVPTEFEIEKATLDFTAEAAELIYNGGEQTLTFAPKTEQIMSGDTVSEYTVSYQLGENSQDAMVNAGTYTVNISLDSENYRLGEVTPSEVEIKPLTVDFTVIVPEDAIYDGEAHKAEVTADGLTEGEDFTVTYTLNGETAEPVGAGEYTVGVQIGNGNYSLGNLSASSFAIGQRTVDFAISDTEHIHRVVGDVYKATVVATPTVDFTVTYDNKATEAVEALSEVDTAGEYDINIVLNDAVNNKIGTISGTQVLTVTDAKPSLKLSTGNAIWTKLDEAAREQFAADYTYNGAVYSPKAWGEYENADMSETAYFVVGKAASYSFDPTALGCTAYDASGNQVTADITQKIDGTAAVDWKITAGVHTMTYSAEIGGKQATAERTLVVILQEVGDVNRDGYVNVGDMRYLNNVVIPSEGGDRSDLLYRYRVCDVNHDGVLDDKDGAAIMNRINESLVPYYN